MIDLFREDLSSTLGQRGCATVEELRQVKVRHPGAYTLADYAGEV